MIAFCHLFICPYISIHDCIFHSWNPLRKSLPHSMTHGKNLELLEFDRYTLNSTTPPLDNPDSFPSMLDLKRNKSPQFFIYFECSETVVLSHNTGPSIDLSYLVMFSVYKYMAEGGLKTKSTQLACRSWRSKGELLFCSFLLACQREIIAKSDSKRICCKIRHYIYLSWMLYIKYIAPSFHIFWGEKKTKSNNIRIRYS